MACIFFRIHHGYALPWCTFNVHVLAQSVDCIIQCLCNKYDGNVDYHFQKCHPFMTRIEPANIICLFENSSAVIRRSVFRIHQSNFGHRNCVFSSTARKLFPESRDLDLNKKSKINWSAADGLKTCFCFFYSKLNRKGRKNIWLRSDNTNEPQILTTYSRFFVFDRSNPLTVETHNRQQSAEAISSIKWKERVPIKLDGSLIWIYCHSVGGEHELTSINKVDYVGWFVVFYLTLECRLYETHPIRYIRFYVVEEEIQSTWKY